MRNIPRKVRRRGWGLHRHRVVTCNVGAWCAVTLRAQREGMLERRASLGVHTRAASSEGRSSASKASGGEWSTPATTKTGSTLAARAKSSSARHRRRPEPSSPTSGGPAKSGWSKADGWSPDGPVANRVVESTGFFPVAHEWVDTSGCESRASNVRPPGNAVER